jgi:hypothetical protein
LEWNMEVKRWINKLNVHNLTCFFHKTLHFLLCTLWMESIIWSGFYCPSTKKWKNCFCQIEKRFFLRKIISESSPCGSFCLLNLSIDLFALKLNIEPQNFSCGDIIELCYLPFWLFFQCTLNLHSKNCNSSDIL